MQLCSSINLRIANKTFDVFQLSSEANDAPDPEFNFLRGIYELEATYRPELWQKFRLYELTRCFVVTFTHIRSTVLRQVYEEQRSDLSTINLRFTTLLYTISTLYEPSTSVDGCSCARSPISRWRFSFRAINDRFPCKRSAFDVAQFQLL